MDRIQKLDAIRAIGFDELESHLLISWSIDRCLGYSEYYEKLGKNSNSAFPEHYAERARMFFKLAELKENFP